MNIKFKILLAFMSLGLSLCFMSNTYSRYVADTTGNVEMLFAKWQILVNEDDITNNSTSSIVLNPVIDKNEYVSNNKIAPSSTGYFDIDIDPSNVEVSFNYSINLDIVNNNIPDFRFTKYSIINNNTNSNENVATPSDELQNVATPTDESQNTATPSDDINTEENKEVFINITDNLIENSLDFDNSNPDFNFSPFTIRVYFEWYEGSNEDMSDEDDTMIATDAENNKIKINAEIKFEQKLSEQV